MEGKAISDLCDEHGLNPSVFYQLQRQFFKSGTRAFKPPRVGSDPAARFQEGNDLPDKGRYKLANEETRQRMRDNGRTHVLRLMMHDVAYGPILAAVETPLRGQWKSGYPDVAAPNACEDRGSASRTGGRGED